MSTEPTGLGPDPEAYLALPRFNKSKDFTFAGQPAIASYALTHEDEHEDWPVMVFFNGLGGHRYITAMIEGIGRAHRIRVLSVDKPGAGGSAPTPDSLPPLHLRTRWFAEALLAVLAAENITRFAMLSHSNGVFYALHFLLHLPPHIEITTWTLSGPFVPPSISGSTSLKIAAALPYALPGTLGTLLQAVPPVSRVIDWSSGLLSVSAGLLGSGSSSSIEGAAAAAAQREPEEQADGSAAHAELKQLPGYIHRYVSPACASAIARRGLAESRIAIGQEAIFSLHGGAPAPAREGGTREHLCVWGLPLPSSSSPGLSVSPSVPALGLSSFFSLSAPTAPPPTDAEILVHAFSTVSSSASSRPATIHVVYGGADGLVPRAGRQWMKKTLKDVGLLPASPVPVSANGFEVTGDAEAMWTEVPDAGHDEVLFDEDVVVDILERVITSSR